MIWDEIRRQHPNMRIPEMQVIRAPFSFLHLEKPDLQAQHSICSLVPKKAGVAHGKCHRSGCCVDMSWIKYPYEHFVIVPNDASPYCILVTAEAMEASERNPNGGWVFVSDLIAGDRRDSAIVCSLTTMVQDGLLLGLQSELEDFESDGFKTINKAAARTGIRPAAPPSCGCGIAHGAMLNTVNLVQMTVIAVMAMLSCKNVDVVTRQAPRQQRRAAEREGLPLVSWHELVVHGPSGGGPQTIGPESGSTNALHWVRGHFKDYREAGLFGRAKAVYWWSPHLAGQADRVVFKDYHVQ